MYFYVSFFETSRERIKLFVVNVFVSVLSPNTLVKHLGGNLKVEQENIQGYRISIKEPRVKKKTCKYNADTSKLKKVVWLIMSYNYMWYLAYDVVSIDT